MSLSSGRRLPSFSNQQGSIPSFTPLAFRPQGRGIGRDRLLSILDEALTLIEDEDFSMDR